MVRFLLPVATLWQRELYHFWRQKSRVLGVVASPLIFWLVIGFGSGEQGPRFFFPGTIVLTVMFSAIFSTISIIEDRREGFLLSMLVSPASRASLVLGKTLGAATLAWIQGAILLVFAPVAGFHPGLLQLLEVAGALFLIALALSAMGFFFAWKFDSSQGYHAVMNLLMMPMWLVSGAVFSIASAHGWIRAIMWVNPLTYSLSLLRGLLAEAPDPAEPSLAAGFAVTTAFGLALLAASVVLANRKSVRNVG
ncbi:MAG: ABC transporter permease [Acidobacteria bacterium]|nr:ABC transporter permease [Acidobacteriota bacterium]